MPRLRMLHLGHAHAPPGVWLKVSKLIWKLLAKEAKEHALNDVSETMAITNFG